MKVQFELTLKTQSESKVLDKSGNFLWNTDSIDVLLAEDIIKLVLQFTLLVSTIQRRLHEEEMLESRIINDDIPF